MGFILAACDGTPLFVFSALTYPTPEMVLTKQNLCKSIKTNRKNSTQSPIEQPISYQTFSYQIVQVYHAEVHIFL